MLAYNSHTPSVPKEDIVEPTAESRGEIGVERPERQQRRLLRARRRPPPQFNYTLEHLTLVLLYKVRAQAIRDGDMPRETHFTFRPFLFLRYLDTWPVRGVPSPDHPHAPPCDLPLLHVQRGNPHQVFPGQQQRGPSAAAAPAPYPDLGPQCCLHHRISSSRKGSSTPARRAHGSLAPEHLHEIDPGNYAERDIFREECGFPAEESPSSSTPPPSPPPPPAFASRRGLLRRKDSLEADVRQTPTRCGGARAPKRWRMMPSLSQSTPAPDDEESVRPEGDGDETATDEASDEGGFASNGGEWNMRPMQLR